MRVVPKLGPLLSEVIVPLVACSLIYAAAAADRGATPALHHVTKAFGAPAAALIAIVAASLVTSAAQWLAAWWIADANLLDGAGMPDDMCLLERRNPTRQ